MFGINTVRRWWNALGAPAPYETQLPQLLATAAALGLPGRDVANVQDFLEYGEWYLAFDTMVTQLFEYGLPLTADFYEQLEACAAEMQPPPDPFSYLLLLVKN
jgi:hypothetical protein